MSSPPSADAVQLNGQPDATLGCLSTAIPPNFHRGWPSDGDVVPADFGVAWAMAGVDWRIEMDLDGAPLESGPIASGAWQSFALASSLQAGSSHTLTRRMYEGETLVHTDEVAFSVADVPSSPAATPSVQGLTMVEDHPQPCDWEPIFGSACEADLVRHGCANPIKSFPSYTMDADPNTLLYVVRSADGTTEVSAAECPALREVISWNCPESACVTITAVGRDGRLGASVEHCDEEGAWVRAEGSDDGDGGNTTSDGATTTEEPDATSESGGCAVSNNADFVTGTMGVLLVMALVRGVQRADRAVHSRP